MTDPRVAAGARIRPSAIRTTNYTTAALVYGTMGPMTRARPPPAIPPGRNPAPEEIVWIQNLQLSAPSGDNAPSPDSASRPAWAARFSAVKTWAVDWARLAPERVLYGSDRSGVAQIYAWDQAAGTHTPLTTKPSGVQADLSWLAEDGQTVYYLDDVGGSETGRLVRLPFSGGAPEVVDPSLPPLSIGWVKSLAGGVVLFDGSDATGYRIYRHEGAGPSQVLYEHQNEAYGDTMSHDHRRLAIVTSEQAPNRHWHITVLDAATGARQAELDDGPQATANSNAWAPFDGDDRVLYTSNVSGRNLPGIWDVAADTRQALTLNLPGEITGVDWLPDGQGVLLAQHHEGRVQLYTFDLARQTATPLPHSPGTLAPLHVRPDGAIWYNYESAAAVDQVRALEGGQERRLLGGEQALPGTPLEIGSLPQHRGRVHSRLPRRAARSRPLPGHRRGPRRPGHPRHRLLRPFPASRHRRRLRRADHQLSRQQRLRARLPGHRAGRSGPL